MESNPPKPEIDKQKIDSVESAESKRLRIFIFAGIGFIALMIAAGLFAFFFNLRGAEQTMVPDVEGMEVLDALLAVQEKELTSHIQVRFSSDPGLKGKVVEQKPAFGTLVKAGRTVTLVVSKGAIVDNVENFIGRDLNEVRIHLQTLFTTYKPLLRIKEPVTYVFDDSEPGTILQQKPEAGTELVGLTDLELVVSRGKEEEKMVLPLYVGIPFDQAIDVLAENNIPFVFSLSEEEGEAGTIIDQKPAAGEEVPMGSIVRLDFVKPEEIEGRTVFGMFQYELPDYAIPVELRLEAVYTTGERSVVFEMKHPGGSISLPYVEEENTVLSLSIFDREVIRHIVRAPVEEEPEI